jgi:hypothetical protein
MKRHGSTDSLPHKASPLWLHRGQIARQLTLWHTQEVAEQAKGIPDHVSKSQCTKRSSKVEASTTKAAIKIWLQEKHA